jgi:hypothetical protein
MRRHLLDPLGDLSVPATVERLCGVAAIDAYLGAQGPATVEQFGAWLSGGFFGRRQLRAWFAAHGDRTWSTSGR